MNDLLRTDQVAERLTITEQRLALWRRDGIGPKFIKMGERTIRYRAQDVDEWVNAQAEQHAKEV